MIYTKKGFTLFELMIVVALIGIFFLMTSYMSRDVRIYQTRAERLANDIYDRIRISRNNMIIGRWVLSWSTLVVTTQRDIAISNTGIVTTYKYNSTNTGTESTLASPFFDSDPEYQISNIAVSSGAMVAWVVPLWDQTGATSAVMTIMPNSDITISAIKWWYSISSPIRTLKVTAEYQWYEQSVVIDRVSGNVEIRKSTED